MATIARFWATKEMLIMELLKVQSRNLELPQLSLARKDLKRMQGENVYPHFNLYKVSWNNLYLLDFFNDV